MSCFVGFICTFFFVGFSDEKDPFNRSPLRLDQVIICTELQERIRQWMRENNIEEPTSTSYDCVT